MLGVRNVIRTAFVHLFHLNVRDRLETTGVKLVIYNEALLLVPAGSSSTALGITGAAYKQLVLNSCFLQWVPHLVVQTLAQVVNVGPRAVATGGDLVRGRHRAEELKDLFKSACGLVGRGWGRVSVEVGRWVGGLG